MKKSEIIKFLDAVPGDPELFIMDLIADENGKKAKPFITAELKPEIIN